MPKVQITNTVSMDISSSCSLGDLRAFLEMVEHDPPNTRVRFSYSRGHQLDPESYTITVDRAP